MIMRIYTIALICKKCVHKKTARNRADVFGGRQTIA